MNKRIAKKLAKKVQLESNEKLKKKCTRYVLEAANLKQRLEVEIDRANDLLLDKNFAESKNTRYLEEIKKLENQLLEANKPWWKKVFKWL